MDSDRSNSPRSTSPRIADEIFSEVVQDSGTEIEDDTDEDEGRDRGDHIPSPRGVTGGLGEAAARGESSGHEESSAPDSDDNTNERLSIYYGYGDTSDDPNSHIPGVQLHYAESVESIPEDTETRYITHTYIEGKIPDSLCEIASKLKHLKSRELTNSLDLYHLFGNEHLEVLDLSGNKMSSGYHFNYLLKLHKLKELHLRDCGLTQLPLDLAWNENLEVLDLSGNKMSYDHSLDYLSKFIEIRELYLQTVDCGLTDLCVTPSTIEYLEILEELEILTLSNEKLSNEVFPSIVFKLHKLRKLYLNRCGLKDFNIQLCMRNLRSLEVLDVSMNELPASFSQCLMSALYDLKVLNLANCELTDIPNLDESEADEEVLCLGSLKRLEVLDVSFNTIPHYVQSQVISKLENLKSLNLSRCRLLSLSDSLDSLKHLELLDVSGNKFDYGVFPRVISNFKYLRNLNISSCELRDIQVSLGTLKHLEVLDVSWNNLPNDSLDILMSGQTCLRTLNLRNCAMKDVSISVKPSSILEVLDLGNNTFSNGVLPRQIGEFNSLIKLTLAGCGLATLPHSMNSLQYLKVLNISSNKFPDGVLPGVISELYNLSVLRVEDCGLSDLPESFSQLRCLRELNISNNKFKVLPYITFQLLHLRMLYISNCQVLEKINQEVLNLKELQTMDCSRCTALRLPPYGVCEQGLTAIRKYFKELKEGVSIERKVVPVIVLGNTMAGKTSIIRSLQEGERRFTSRKEGSMSDEATRVFKMERLDYNGIQFNFIDFGGHSVYHVAYQLGIKDRCVPIFVVNMEEYNILATARGPLEATRRLWFDYMSHLYLVCPQLDSPLLVLTHRDRIPTEQFEPLRTTLITSAEQLRKGMLKEETDLSYGTSDVCKIDIFVNTSKRLVVSDHIFVFSDDTQETSNIINLRNTLEKCCSKLAVVIPRLWERVTSFMNQHKDKTYMHLSDIEAEFSGSEPLIIIRYLHNIGRILWYEDKEVLSGYVFHRIPELIKLVGLLFSHTQDQEWADRIINFDPFLYKGAHISKAKYEELVDNFKEFGIMDEAVLHRIVTNFPCNIATEILKAFQLIYGPVKHEMRDSYIIPYLSNQFLDTSWQDVGYLQLRVALTFPALLSLPHNVYQSMSVCVLDMNSQPGNEIRVAKNGVEICSECTVTHLIHDPNNRRVTLQLSTDKIKLLSQLWVKLLENTYTVMKMVTKEWPAARPVTHVYCSHCLFMKKDNPSCYVDPKWFNFSLRELTVFRDQTFTGAKPVRCKNYKAPAGCRQLAVPRPLRFPCWTLEEPEVKIVEGFLEQLKPPQCSVKITTQPLDSKLPSCPTTSSNFSSGVDMQGAHSTTTSSGADRLLVPSIATHPKEAEANLVYAVQEITQCEESSLVSAQSGIINLDPENLPLETFVGSQGAPSPRQHMNLEPRTADHERLFTFEASSEEHHYGARPKTTQRRSNMMSEQCTEDHDRRNIALASFAEQHYDVEQRYENSANSGQIRKKRVKFVILKSDCPSDESEEEAEDTDSELSDVEKEGYIKSGLLSRPVPLKLVPCRKRRLTRLYNNTEKVYHMSDPVRGRVLIFNINSKIPDRERPGSEIDYKNISKLFIDMGFCIAKSEHELTDLTTERIFNEIKKETRKAEHNKLGMFVLVMMGHGSRGDYMKDAEGKLIDISRVKECLSPKEFRTMSGKPKLMIIQACSGGVPPINIPAAPPAPSVVESVALPQSVVSLNGADLYVMKASDESFDAIRSISKGSWFITTLVATFYKHACHRDVESLFKIVQQRLAKYIAANPPPIGTRVGFPVDQCTFTNYRKLFFFPGYSPRK